MAFTVRTVTEIDAPQSVVWDILSAPEHWAEWNDVLLGLEGTLAVDRRLKLTLGSGGRKLKIPVKLKVYDAPRELAWAGGFALAMKGHHGFRIERIDDERVRFVHYERFSGPASLVAKPLLMGMLQKSYDHVNRKLKERAEAQSPCSNRDRGGQV